MAYDYLYEELQAKLSDFLQRNEAVLSEKGSIHNISQTNIVESVKQEFSETYIANYFESVAQEWFQKAKADMSSKLELRANLEVSFLNSNMIIWKDALEHAEMLYLMTIEMSNRYHAYLNNNLSNEVFEKIKHRMFVLGKLHGRACQVYCEVLWLLRGGFSDGAYARWRSLYELSVIAEFIKANDEAIAMKFTDSAYFDEKDYEWAKSAPCFAHLAKKSRINFEMIRKQCEIIAESWKNAYKDSCQVVHATPLGTLGRIGSRDETKSTLVGPSDYGLEIPGVNAAISLMHVTMFYFGMANHADSKVFILTMQKWLDELIDCYRNIATNAFLQGSPAE